MKIGIIGAGFVGRTIAKLAVGAGHEVMVSNSRGPQSLFSLPYAIGCQVGTVDEAAQFGEMVLVAVPLHAYRDIPADLLAGKLVVDANNYYPERDGRIAELDRGETTSSELLAAHLAQSRVVKAFNAIPMHQLESDGLPVGAAKRRALPLAGNQEHDKALVAQLYEQFGLDAVDAGSLVEGRRFETGTPAYCTFLTKDELTQALAAWEA